VIAAAPAVAMFAVDSPPSQRVAGPCGGGVNIPLFAEGAPVNNCAPVVAPPATTGGAPSQQTLTGCARIPGCLSNALYGPGNVVVPNRDSTVHQSQ
jgi:hypothetical protein